MIVDETLLPGRRRLVFRQFIFNNAHRYGVKLFKFCFVDGCTWAIKVYCEKSATGEREVGLAEKVCLELHKNFSEKVEPCMLTIFTLGMNLRFLY